MMQSTAETENKSTDEMNSRTVVESDETASSAMNLTPKPNAGKISSGDSETNFQQSEDNSCFDFEYTCAGLDLRPLALVDEICSMNEDVISSIEISTKTQTLNGDRINFGASEGKAMSGESGPAAAVSVEKPPAEPEPDSSDLTGKTKSLFCSSAESSTMDEAPLSTGQENCSDLIGETNRTILGCPKGVDLSQHIVENDTTAKELKSVGMTEDAGKVPNGNKDKVSDKDIHCEPNIASVHGSEVISTNDNGRGENIASASGDTAKIHDENRIRKDIDSASNGRSLVSEIDKRDTISCNDKGYITAVENEDEAMQPKKATNLEEKEATSISEFQQACESDSYGSVTTQMAVQKNGVTENSVHRSESQSSSDVENSRSFSVALGLNDEGGSRSSSTCVLEGAGVTPPDTNRQGSGGLGRFDASPTLMMDVESDDSDSERLTICEAAASPAGQSRAFSASESKLASNVKITSRSQRCSSEASRFSASGVKSMSSDPLSKSAKTTTSGFNNASVSFDGLHPSTTTASINVSSVSISPKTLPPVDAACRSSNACADAPASVVVGCTQKDALRNDLRVILISNEPASKPADNRRSVITGSARRNKSLAGLLDRALANCGGSVNTSGSGSSCSVGINAPLPLVVARKIDKLSALQRDSIGSDEAVETQAGTNLRAGKQIGSVELIHATTSSSSSPVATPLADVEMTGHKASRRKRRFNSAAIALAEETEVRVKQEKVDSSYGDIPAPVVSLSEGGHSGMPRQIATFGVRPPQIAPSLARYQNSRTIRQASLAAGVFEPTRPQRPSLVSYRSPSIGVSPICFPNNVQAARGLPFVTGSNGARYVVPPGRTIAPTANLVAPGTTAVRPFVEQANASPVVIVVNRPRNTAPCKPATISSSANRFLLSSSGAVTSAVAASCIAAGVSVNGTIASFRAPTRATQRPVVVVAKHGRLMPLARPAQLWQKFRHWFNSNALGTRSTVLPPPADLLMGTIRADRCVGCGDEFATPEGLADHYARRSLRVSFTCRCGRQPPPHVFYNVCSFAAAYKSHVAQFAMQHSLPDTCRMDVLPADEMGEEYRAMLTAGNSGAGKSSGENGNTDMDGYAVWSGSVIVDSLNGSSRKSSTDSPGSAGGDSIVSSAAAVSAAAAPFNPGASKTHVSASSAASANASLAFPSSSSSTASTSTNSIKQPILNEGISGAVVWPAASNLTSDSGNGGGGSDNGGSPGEPDDVLDLAVALETRRVLCPVCRRLYRDRAALVSHFAKHSSLDSIACVAQRCECCDMIPLNSCAATAHKGVHVMKVEEMLGAAYVCPECGTSFDRHDVFMKHVEKVCLHFARVAGFKCPKCPAVLAPSVDAASRHMTDAHAATYRKCVACPMAFTSDAGFQRHSVEKHAGAAVQNTIGKCPICDKVLPSLDDLRVHISRHAETTQPTRSYSFLCPACSERFLTKPLLAAHMRATHSEHIITGHMCESCGAVFDDSLRSLAAHIDVAHPEHARKIRAEFAVNSAVKGDAARDGGSGQPERKRQKKGGIRDEELGCERCQVRFADEEQWKRHHAKHRYLAGKKVTSEGQSLKTKMSIVSKAGNGVAATDEATSGGSVVNGSDAKKGDVREMSDGRGFDVNAKDGSTEKKTDADTTIDDRLATSQNGGSIDAKAIRVGLKRKFSSARHGVAVSSKRQGLTGRKLVKMEAFKTQVPTAAPDLKHSCTECDTRFASDAHVRAHLVAAHAMTHWFACHLCALSFRDAPLLHSHVKDAHSGRARQHAFICWVCREQAELKSYPRLVMLAKHLKSAHKIGRSHTEYAKLRALEIATKSELLPSSPIPSPPNAIDVSPRGSVGVSSGGSMANILEENSTGPSTRRLHIDGESSYACARCDYASIAREDFLAHLSERHRASAASHDSHQCAECGACFAVILALRRHLFVVHQVRDLNRYARETGVQLDSDAKEGADAAVSPPKPSPPAKAVVERKMSNARPEAPDFGGETSPGKVGANGDDPSKDSKDVERLECTVCYKQFEDIVAHRSHMRVHGMAFIQRTRRSLAPADSGVAPLASEAALTASEISAS